MRTFQLRRRKNNSAMYVMVRRLNFSSDGTILAASTESMPGIMAVEVHSGRMPQLPATHEGRTTCAAFSRNGEYLALGGSDGRARPYRLADGGLLAELMPVTRGWGIRELKFAPTADSMAQWLAVCGSEFWLWNPVTQQYLIAPERDYYLTAAFDPSANYVTVVSDANVCCFRLKPFGAVWQIPHEPLTGRSSNPRRGRTPLCTSACDSAVVIGDGVALHVLDPDNGNWRDTIRLPATMNDIAFLPNSRLLAVADGSPVLRIYDTDNGQLAREYDWGIGGIHCVTFSNDGAMGAAGGDKGRVVVWDLE